MQGIADIVGPITGERLIKVLGHANIIDDESVVLVRSRYPVGAGDGLQQAVLLERAIQVHHRFVRRVEPSQQLVADDEDAQRVGAVEEAGHHALLALAILGQPDQIGTDASHPRIFARLGVLLAAGVHARTAAFGLGLGVLGSNALGDQGLRDDAIQGPLVQDHGLTVDGDQLRLEAVRLAVRLEMRPGVQGNQLDATWMFGQFCDGDATLLDGVDGRWRLIGEPLVELDVQLGWIDLPLGLAPGVADRHGGPVTHGVVDAVAVEVAFAGYSEVGVGVLVRRLDRRAGEAEEAGVRQGGSQKGSEVALLGSMAFIHQHDPGSTVSNRCATPFQLLDGGQDGHASAAAVQQALQVLAAVGLHRVR